MISHRELTELKSDKHHYKDLHQHALDKNKKFEEQLKREQAQVCNLTYHLYGKKTKESTAKSEMLFSENDAVSSPQALAKWGVNLERANHPRHKSSHLPIEEEVTSISDKQPFFPEHDKAYLPFSKQKIQK